MRYKLLFALSLFKDGAVRKALGEVSDLGELDRDDGLVALEKLSLVNRESERFKVISPLVEVYIRDHLAKDAALEDQLRERWINCLLEFINQRYQKKYDTIDEVISETKNILDVIDWCRKERRYETVLQFTSKIDFYLWASGSWNLRYDYLHCGLDSGSALNNNLAQAIFCRKLADVRDMQGDWQQSLKWASTSLYLFEGCSDEYGTLLVLFRLGALYYKLREFQLAKDVTFRALDIARKFEDNKTFMRLEGRLGTIYLEEGDLHSAKLHLERAVQIEKALDDYQRKTWSSPWVYRLVGRLYLAEKCFEEAKESLAYSLDLAKSINNPQEIAETTSYLAELYFLQGYTEQAIKMARSALELSKMLGMKWYITRIENLLRDTFINEMIIEDYQLMQNDDESAQG